MGAWGHESFANDSALDWLETLVRGEPALLTATLERAADAENEYLEVDESAAALAAAELVAAAFGRGCDRLPDKARAWVRVHGQVACEAGTDRARRAVQRVFQDSELRELWEENGEDTEWHADVRELLRRLSD